MSSKRKVQFSDEIKTTYYDLPDGVHLTSCLPVVRKSKKLRDLSEGEVSKIVTSSHNKKPAVLFVGHSWINRLDKYLKENTSDPFLDAFQLLFLPYYTLKEALNKFPKFSLNKQPSVVFIHIGANDIQNSWNFCTPIVDVKYQLVNFLEQISARFPRAKLVFSEVEYRFTPSDLELPPESGTNLFQAFRRWIDQAHRQNKLGGVHRLMLYAKRVSQRRLYLIDGIHLTDEGMSLYLASYVRFLTSCAPCTNSTQKAPLLTYCVCNKC